MAKPQQVNVWVGLDVGKEEHFAEVLDDDGERIFARSVVNDQAALEALLHRAGEYSTAGLVIDQPNSIAQLALAVARGRQVPVTYVPGLVMPRAAGLYPGEAKTDCETRTSSPTPAGPDANRSTGSMSVPTSSSTVSGSSTGSTSTCRRPNPPDQPVP